MRREEFGGEILSSRTYINAQVFFFFFLIKKKGLTWQSYATSASTDGSREEDTKD
jgi:hypothetical protein